MRHSDIVFNLVGREYETKYVTLPIPICVPYLIKPRALPRNFTYYDVHAKGAEAIATIAAQSGVDRFVHVSHLNAAQDSESAFYRSKAAGEELVKEAFPTATIVRPATMFGYEDRLLNNMACTHTPPIFGL